MGIVDKIKSIFQKEEVIPEKQPELKQSEKQTTVVSKVYECYNCGGQTKSLHECDVCHGFFCFPCFSSHECKVAQPETTIAIDRDYRDGARAVAQRPLGTDFEDGMKAMIERRAALQKAAEEGKNPPKLESDDSLELDASVDNTGKLVEKWRHEKNKRKDI
jgi:hypothetical protein